VQLKFWRNNGSKPHRFKTEKVKKEYKVGAKLTKVG
jgi:hypothetical protein